MPDALPERHASVVQELEHALEGTTTRACTGVGVAGQADAAQPLASELALFAEAQRIIVLDAVRTDFSQSGQRPGASSDSSAPALKGTQAHASTFYMADSIRDMHSAQP